MSNGRRLRRGSPRRRRRRVRRSSTATCTTRSTRSRTCIPTYRGAGASTWRPSACAPPNGGYYPRFMDHREDARPPSGRPSRHRRGVHRAGTSSTATMSPTRSSIRRGAGQRGAGPGSGYRPGARHQRLAGGRVARPRPAAARLDHAGAGGSGGGRRRGAPLRPRPALRAGAVQGPPPGADGPPPLLARSTRRAPRRGCTWPPTRSAAYGQPHQPAPGMPPTTSRITSVPPSRCRPTSPAWWWRECSTVSASS